MAWLCYIGHTYTPGQFIEEARREGFARRIPPSVLPSLRWGDTIYFAQWLGKEDEKPSRAHVFAAGCLSRLIVEDPEAMELITEELRKRGWVREEIAGEGRWVKRRCGYYYTGNLVTVSCELSKVVEIYMEVKARLGRHIPIMIAGKLEQIFEPPKEVHAPFTRGLLRVKDDLFKAGLLDLSVATNRNDKEVQGIRDHVVARKKDDWIIPLPL